MKTPTIIILLLSIAWVCGNAGRVLATAGDHVLTVDEAVRIGIANNPIIQQAKEMKEGAVHESQSAMADLLPKIAADYSYTNLAEDPYVVMNGNMQAQVASSTQYHWGITLIQPLFTGFALTAKHDISKLNIEVKEKEKQQSILDVTKGIKSTYYQVLLTGKMVNVAEETVMSLQSHLDDAQRFYDRGIIRLNDLLRAKVALADAVHYREKLRAAVQVAQSDLNRWLAFDINHDISIADITTVPAIEADLDLLLVQGMNNRPLLQVMSLAEKILEKNIVLEESGYFPEVVLTGGYEQDGDNLQATNNDFGNDHNAFVSLNANWTLFDWNKKEANVGSVRAKIRGHRASIRKIEDIIKLEIKNAYLNLQVAQRNIETSRESLKLANENLRITSLGYRHQVATSTEVLDVRTDLTRAQSTYYQSLYGYMDALAGLERATGMQLDK